MLPESQRELIEVVLVSPRNPLNIGAVARAMANFGFSRLAVVAPYADHWREARSAVGAPDLLLAATAFATLAEAVAGCTLVVGTGSLAHRKPEQPQVPLPNLTPLVEKDLTHGGRVALVFGPEKHGLTREDLSYCHLMVEIPTDSRQPSMNLGQAVAVCLYELTLRPLTAGAATQATDAVEDQSHATSTSDLDRLAAVVEEVMLAADYSPPAMQEANRYDLRLLLRRLALARRDTRRILGLFRRILWQLKRTKNTG